MSVGWKIIAVMALAVCIATPAGAEPSVSYLVDFTDYDEGPVEDWLVAKGFALEADADNRRRIDLDANGDGLAIEALRRARALLMYERADIADFRKVRITWRVDRFPQDANWDAGVRNEAIMVMVFFGHERISSGSLLIPNSPFFIGLVLCGQGSVGTAHVGRSFRKGGRYVCLDQPQAGQVVTSEYDLVEAFKSFFDADDVPVVSGIALQADTTDSGGGGRSLATITSVQFLENE